MPERLMTRSEVLATLGITGDRFEYVIRRFRVPPAQRVGIRRYYSAAQVKRIGQANNSVRKWTTYETQFPQEQADDTAQVGEGGTACPQ